MGTRIVLGGILILALAGVFLLDQRMGGGWIFSGLVLVGVVWGLKEVFRLLPPLSALARGIVLIGTVLLLIAANHPSWGGGDLYLVFLVLVPALLTVAALGQSAPEAGLEEAGCGIFAFMYLGVFPSVLVLIRRMPEGWELVLAVLISTKAADMGAYFTGRLLGRHKLAPGLSPNKTVEGLLGGLAFSSFMTWLMLGPVFEVSGMTWPVCLIVGMFMGVAGTAGDLVESLLKRGRGVKDSGAVLPGFGGVLDMIDSPLLSAPVALAILSIIR